MKFKCSSAVIYFFGYIILSCLLDIKHPGLVYKKIIN